MFGSRPAQQQQQNRAPVIRRAIRGDMAPPPAPPLMPPPLAPASSYHTANTHAPTEADEATQRSTQEDDGTGAKPAEPADPFEGLWGKLVPCNSSMETIDLRVEQPQYIVGRSNDAQIQIPHPKISAYLSFRVHSTLFCAPGPVPRLGLDCNGADLILQHGGVLFFYPQALDIASSVSFTIQTTLPR